MSGTDRLVGCAPVAPGVGRWASRHRLRVLAMHGVADGDRFDRQLRELLGWFRPVSSEQVLAWYRLDAELPDRAVWLTFDDGERSTLTVGSEVLARHGVPATVFVCPAFVGSDEQPWWQTVVSAAGADGRVELDGVGHTAAGAVTALKSIPDHDRRRIVRGLARTAPQPHEPVELEDLLRWRERGGDIGNHTWDHPCLDRCDDAEQTRQIDRASDWLDERGLWERRLFAYPNGDRTEHAERHLRDRGYDLVALFDHALATRARGALRVSRLRLDAGATIARTAAVTSGWHSSLFALRRSVAGGAGPRRRA